MMILVIVIVSRSKLNSTVVVSAFFSCHLIGELARRVHVIAKALFKSFLHSSLAGETHTMYSEREIYCFDSLKPMVGTKWKKFKWGSVLK